MTTIEELRLARSTFRIWTSIRDEAKRKFEEAQTIVEELEDTIADLEERATGEIESAADRIAEGKQQ